MNVEEIIHVCALTTQMYFGKMICIELATKRKTSLKCGLFGSQVSKGEIPKTVKNFFGKESSISVCGL